MSYALALLGIAVASFVVGFTRAAWRDRQWWAPLLKDKLKR